MTAYIHADTLMQADVNLPQVGTVYSAKQSVPAPAIPYQVNLKYQNIDVKANQYGITLNAEWVATEKLVFKAFGTYQLTKLKDHNC